MQRWGNEKNTASRQIKKRRRRTLLSVRVLFLEIRCLFRSPAVASDEGEGLDTQEFNWINTVAQSVMFARLNSDEALGIDSWSLPILLSNVRVWTGSFARMARNPDSRGRLFLIRTVWPTELQDESTRNILQHSQFIKRIKCTMRAQSLRLFFLKPFTINGNKLQLLVTKTSDLLSPKISFLGI